MSELIDNSRKKKDVLKHMLLQLHRGQAPREVQAQLVQLMGEVPYEHVVEVEQELIAEGMPSEEILKFCDLHSQALRGHVSQQGVPEVPPGHPVHTFKEENRALQWEISSLKKLFETVDTEGAVTDIPDVWNRMRSHFNALSDIEKHYQRKENLLFPFLEKHGITGPSTVMWGKHDETRALLKRAMETFQKEIPSNLEEVRSLVRDVFQPAVDSIEEMIYKEEEILFPMSLKNLTESEWYHVYRQSPEIGFCLYDPTDRWTPSQEVREAVEEKEEEAERIQLPSGSFTPTELNAILNTIPFDLTFVDKDDTVRYFTQGRERIFARNRAILGRKVQLCHPPSSVHIVERILEDFRSGKQDRAPFWINLHGQFIHIEYFALRDEEGNYLGTLEVSQNLTEKRKLEGEQRLLTYPMEDKHPA